MQESLDIVIPSYRLDEHVLKKIFSLERPVDIEIKIYLISDNPKIQISNELIDIIESRGIKLLINPVNLGFSKTRNRGIEAGKGKWILLLDDDIHPDANLLFAYSEAIKSYPDSIGFVGVTLFPPPCNIITEALTLNGSVGHFQSALNHQELSWAPTANIVLNRKLLGKRRFNPKLVYGGEDIELLIKNSVENGKKYFSAPSAVVTHPWWNKGGVQTKRMFRYGLGLSDIISLPYLNKYSFRDFFSTSESFIVISVLSLFVSLTEKDPYCLLKIFPIVLFSELLTNYLKTRVLTSRFSLILCWQMTWHKNCYEAGFVWGVLSSGKLWNLGKRLDVSFKKEYPGSYRLNRWKITKILIILILTALTLLIKYY